MTDSSPRPSAVGQPARVPLAHDLRHGWPLPPIVLSGVALAIVVLDQSVFAR